MVAGALAAAVLAAVLVITLVLPRLGGEDADEAQPAPTSETSLPTLAPTEQPEPSQGETSAPTETAPQSEPASAPTQTVTTTVAPSPAPQETVYVTVPAAPEEPTSPDGAIPTQAEALAGLELYFSTVPGNPSAGWELLTVLRQGVEDWPSYEEWWSSVRAAEVSDCSYDAGNGVAECTLWLDTASGETTSDARFWMTMEDGIAKIDVKDRFVETSYDPVWMLEAYRSDSLTRASLDGRWVAVLSAKRPGITDPQQVAANGSHTFYEDDILILHEDLAYRFSYADVILLLGTDWGKQTSNSSDLWFTIADLGPDTTEAEVQQWCAASFPGTSGKELENNCLPRQLTGPRN